MPRGYHHLTQDERCQIWGLKKSGLSQRDIGRELGRHHTTIRREMQRNSGGRGYRYKQAHNKATERRHRASSVPRKMTPALWQLVEEKLGSWLEPRANFGSAASGRPSHGGADADLRIRPHGPQGWWQPIQAAAAAGKETELARRPPRRAGTHSRVVSISVSGLRSSNRSRGSVTGRRTRLSVQVKAAQWLRWWTALRR